MEKHRMPTSVGPSVSAAMREKAAAGYVIGAARLGYAPTRTALSLGVEHVPDPAVAPLVREAFAMAAAGRSIRQVAARLAVQGVKGNRGNPVSLATVQRMLTEPFYAGFVRDRAGCLAIGRHEALVDPKTFSTVQRKLMEKRCSPVKANGTPQPIQ